MPVPDTIQYNGIVLEVTAVQNYDREPLLDGPTYLYSRHRLTVLAIYNPAATSYTFAGKADPTSQKGYVGPFTDTAIRHHLQQPRRKLTYRVGDVIVLDSPGFDSKKKRMVVDCYNGPTVTHVDVTRIHGTKTFAVSFSVETYVNECNLFKTSVPALVSHRWTRHEDIDQDYFSTIQTEGRAMFRTDVLNAEDIKPDDFRAYLFHPVPNGYKRMHVHVTAVDDGATLQYSVTDRMLPAYFSISGVSRIEAYHTVQCKSLNIEEIAMQTAQAGVSHWTETAAAVASAGATMGIAAVKAVLCNLPKTNLVIDAKVFGKPDSTRKSLERVAIGIIMSRLGVSLSGITEFTGGKEISLTHDITGKVVHCHCTLSTYISLGSYPGLVGAPYGSIPAVGIYFPSPEERSIADLASWAGVESAAAGFIDAIGLRQRAKEIMRSAERRLIDSEKTFDPRTEEPILSDIDGPGLTLPNYNGTRGFRFEHLATQVLLDPCGTHKTPTQRDLGGPNPEQKTLIDLSKATDKGAFEDVARINSLDTGMGI